MSTLELSDYTLSWPVYCGPDADEKTGAREPVQVTRIRVEEDADMVGDPPRYRECNQYFIAAAHRVVFGAAIPEGELSAMAALDRWDDSRANAFVLLPEEEEALCDYIDGLLEDASLIECGFAPRRGAS